MYVGRGWETEVVRIGQSLTKAKWTSWKMVTIPSEKVLKQKLGLLLGKNNAATICNWLSAPF